MTRMGPLEAMARMDLDALVEEVKARYQPGMREARAAADPAWGKALTRVEGEAGALYEALREADAALADWRRTLGELAGLWQRVEVPGRAGVLDAAA